MPSAWGGVLEFGSKQTSFTFMNPGQSLGRDLCPQELVSSWGVAQSAERRTVNADVGGSSPPAPASDNAASAFGLARRFAFPHPRLRI